MAYGLNGSEDNRFVELQGKENEQRQAELVNAFFWLGGKILDGTDSTTKQPQTVNGNSQGIGINPATGEFFRVGVPGSETGSVRRQQVSDAPVNGVPPIMVIAGLAFLFVLLKGK